MVQFYLISAMAGRDVRHEGVRRSRIAAASAKSERRVRSSFLLMLTLLSAINSTKERR